MTKLLDSGPTSAPALIMLHGWGASKEIWEIVFRPPLSGLFRLIALDLPGTGATPLTDSCDMNGMADWVAGEATRLGIERFAVLGHSMGANVAVQMAQRHARRVSGLVLVGAALQSDRLVHAQWGLHPIIGAAALDSSRYLAGVAGWIEGRMPPTSASQIGWGRGYMRRSGYMMSNNSRRALQAQLKGLIETPADLKLVSPDIPVLFIHGAKDSTIPLQWAKESINARAQNTRLLVYKRALHCPMDTHTQRFADDVAAFFGRAFGPHEALGGAAGSPPESIDGRSATVESEEAEVEAEVSPAI